MNTNPYLIVGLGNPGPKYETTYHNCGWMALDAIADAFNISLLQTKFNSLLGHALVHGQTVILAKPLTFMNNSGVAVRALMDYFKIPAEQVLILYDDFDIESGTVRMRKKGSAGTHNGMRSLVQHMGTTDFPRIRIGIGPKPVRMDIIDFVLAVLTKVDAERIGACFDDIVQAIEIWIRFDIDAAMNDLNRKRKQITKEPS